MRGSRQPLNVNARQPKDKPYEARQTGWQTAGRVALLSGLHEIPTSHTGRQKSKRENDKMISVLPTLDNELRRELKQIKAVLRNINLTYERSINELNQK